MLDDRHTAGRTGPHIVRYPKYRVTVAEGPDQGVERILVNQTLRVGSSSDNDLALTDPFVSRSHCALQPVSDGLRIRDEGSRNGVRLDGLRIVDAITNGPARLHLGDTVLSIEPLGVTEEREQALENRFGDLLGQSACMRELFADLARIAKTDVTLLIEGETGTGKELIADSVHSASGRAEGPFVIFDCGAVAPTLAESEIFGHERGAFTGAVAARPGVFEQADGGTVVLDEIGELPKDLQPKLLRVLESRTVRRLGSRNTITVNTRVIAATNRNLEAEVKRGHFRQDLFYRLEAAHVHVPPLRDRMEDLPLLTEHFLSQAVPPRSLDEIPPDVWGMFLTHRWPGNVRELNNAVQRLLVTPERVFRSSPSSSAGRPPPAPTDLAPLRVARRQAGEDFERHYLQQLLEQAEGNMAEAMRIAEVSRQMIQRLLRKHGLGS